MYSHIPIVRMLYRKIQHLETYHNKDAASSSRNFFLKSEAREAACSKVHAKYAAYFKRHKLLRNRRNFSASELVPRLTTSEFPCRAYT